MAGRAAEAFGQARRIAVVAAGADLRAARHGVPRRVGPFDGGLIGHTFALCHESIT